MALIKCPECGKEISDTVNRCINCGYEIKKSPQYQKCPECGRDIIDTTRPCSYCGYEVIRSSQASYNSMEQSREYRPRHESYDDYYDSEYMDERYDPRAKKATIGFVLSLCGLLGLFSPIIGIILGIIAIVFSVKGLNTRNRGKAIAGIIISIVDFVIALNAWVYAYMVYMGYYK